MLGLENFEFVMQKIDEDYQQRFANLGGIGYISELYNARTRLVEIYTVRP